jgi:serine/threonine protein kinase
MHNLSGVYVKEEASIVHDGLTLYSFSVVYPKKSRYYHVESKEECQLWMNLFKKVTGYSSLTDIYELKEKLGNGKFGLVRHGIHKQSGRKVAVKIMSKKDMSSQDLELIKTEIEILKVCQHPYIIRLYDIFENVDFIYISKQTF